MAAKFFMNGGVDNNWSSDTNWSTTSSAGPNNTTHAIAGDAVTINSGSPACTVDVSSACSSVNFTGYTNTFTLNAQLAFSGSFTLASGMTLAGSSTLNCNNSGGTWTSAGKTVPWNFTVSSGTTGGVTLADDWHITGQFTHSANAAFSYTGHNFSADGGWSETGAANLSGTTVFKLTGTGVFNSLGNPSLNIQLAAGVGTITCGAMRLGTGAVITYVSGTLTAGASCSFNVNQNAGVTFSGFTGGAATWPGDVRVAFSGGITVTLSTDFHQSGNITWVGGGAPGGTLTMAGAFDWYCVNVAPDAGATNSVSGMTLSGNLIASGDLTMDSTTSFTWAGNFNITAATATLSGTMTVNINGHDVNVSGLTTISDACVINTSASKVWNTGGLTTTGALTGTAKIVFTGTGTWTGAAGSLANNCDINTSGTLTLSGTILYTTGTLTYVAGTISAGTSILSLSGACTLATSGMTWANVTIATTGTITLSTTLNVSGSLTLPNTAATFGGSAGFVTGTLTMATLTASRIFTFVHSVEYKATAAFNTVGTTSAIRAAFKSDSAGVKAKISLGMSATQDIGFADPTDIDSNNGQPIFSYKGTITTTFNWTATAPLRIGIPAMGNVN